MKEKCLTIGCNKFATNKFCGKCKMKYRINKEVEAKLKRQGRYYHEIKES